MSRLMTCCAVLLAVACAPGENNADTDTTTVAPTVTLADFAGTWQVRGNNEAGDSLLSYTVVATADTSGWTITFPGRPPVPMRVMLSGDSVMTEAGPYESALRRGVQVRTQGAFRLQNGQLVGRNVARYDVRTADSVLVVHSVGTRSGPIP